MGCQSDRSAVVSLAAAHQQCRRRVVTVVKGIDSLTMKWKEFAALKPEGFRIRLAKPRDAGALSQLHLELSPEDILCRLGRKCLQRYYRVILDDANSVVLCAEEVGGQIMGICSGTLDAKEHQASIRRARFSILLHALPKLLVEPTLIREVMKRRGDTAGFVVSTGAREEYWGWKSGGGHPYGAVILHAKLLSILAGFGATAVQLEVNAALPRVLKTHDCLGAVIVRRYTTPANVPRAALEYRL